MSKKADMWSLVVLLVLSAILGNVFVLSYKHRKLKAAKEYVRNYNGQAPKEDPWGNMYRVTKEEAEGKLTVIVTSAGPDEDFGTKDDLHGGYRKSVEIQ